MMRGMKTISDPNQFHLDRFCLDSTHRKMYLFFFFFTFLYLTSNKEGMSKPTFIIYGWKSSVSSRNFTEGLQRCLFFHRPGKKKLWWNRIYLWAACISMVTSTLFWGHIVHWCNTDFISHTKITWRLASTQPSELLLIDEQHWIKLKSCGRT